MKQCEESRRLNSPDQRPASDRAGAPPRVWRRPTACRAPTATAAQQTHSSSDTSQNSASAVTQHSRDAQRTKILTDVMCSRAEVTDRSISCSLSNVSENVRQCFVFSFQSQRKENRIFRFKKLTETRVLLPPAGRRSTRQL